MKATCEGHTEWDAGIELRAVQYAQVLPQIASVSEDITSSLPTVNFNKVRKQTPLFQRSCPSYDVNDDRPDEKSVN